LLALALVAAGGCSDSKPGVSVNIAGQMEKSGGTKVDLAQANTDPWDRVCMLAPMQNQSVTRKMLGFEWSAGDHTAITRNDGISLLIFVQGNQVAKFTEHPRNLGDFASLTGRCFPRDKAVFYQAPNSQGRAGGMYPIGE